MSEHPEDAALLIARQIQESTGKHWIHHIPLANRILDALAEHRYIHTEYINTEDPVRVVAPLISEYCVCLGAQWSGRRCSDPIPIAVHT